MPRPVQFSFNAARDTFRNHQLRLDGTDRKAPTGRAVPFTPIVAATGITPAWSTLAGRYVLTNDALHVWIKVIFSGNPGGSTTWTFGTPDGMSIAEAFGNWRFSDASTGAAVDGIVLPAAGYVSVACEYRTTHALVVPTYVGNGVPVAAASSDQLWIGYTGCVA